MFLGCLEADFALLAVAPKTIACLSIRLKSNRWRSSITSLPRASTKAFITGVCCFFCFLDEEGVEIGVDEVPKVFGVPKVFSVPRVFVVPGAPGVQGGLVPEDFFF